MTVVPLGFMIEARSQILAFRIYDTCIFPGRQLLSVHLPNQGSTVCDRSAMSLSATRFTDQHHDSIALKSALSAASTSQKLNAALDYERRVGRFLSTARYNLSTAQDQNKSRSCPQNCQLRSFSGPKVNNMFVAHPPRTLWQQAQQRRSRCLRGASSLLHLRCCFTAPNTKLPTCLRTHL